MKKLLAAVVLVSLLFFMRLVPMPNVSDLMQWQALTRSVYDDISDRFWDDTIDVYLNDNKLHLDTAPLLVEGTLMVPLRPLMDALGANSRWQADTGHTVILRGDHTIVFAKDSATVMVDQIPQQMPVPLLNRSGTTYVSARFIAGSLGIPLEWDSTRKRLYLTAEDVSGRPGITIDGQHIALGDSAATVQARFGAPARVDPSVFGFEWHVYNQDYSRFIMIGMANDQVQGLYTNVSSFRALGVSYGDTAVENTATARYYLDEPAGGKVHAVLLLEKAPPADYQRPKYDPALTHAQELENFDCVNAFRVNHGLSVLRWHELAADTARKHSQDMADRDYFDHITPEGLHPWERFEANGGSYTAIGENIYAGHFPGIETFDGWINSPDHRDAILTPHFTGLGVGVAYREDNTYQYHSTELFVR